MKQQKYEVGDKMSMACAACECAREHSILKVSKQGSVSQTECADCGTLSRFRLGVKVSSAIGKPKTVSEYDRRRRYQAGQVMMHSVFGLGEVTAVVGPQKIDVLFGDQLRRLIHHQQ